jgi:hypothetical protein
VCCIDNWMVDSCFLNLARSTWRAIDLYRWQHLCVSSLAKYNMFLHCFSRWPPNAFHPSHCIPDTLLYLRCVIKVSLSFESGHPRSRRHFWRRSGLTNLVHFSKIQQILAGPNSKCVELLFINSKNKKIRKKYIKN